MNLGNYKTLFKVIGVVIPSIAVVGISLFTLNPYISISDN